MSEALRVIGSLIFAAAVVLASSGMFASDGLIWIRQDGTIVFYSDSTGSMAATNEWLFTVIYLAPSAIIRVIRAKTRPALLEIALFGFVLYAFTISYDSIGFDALADTIVVAGDRWLAAGVLGIGAAAGAFLLLVIEGWWPRRHG